MRETCARVVAAALLAGAIATVVGMSVLVDAPREPTAPIATPLSAVERSVPLTAHVAARRARSAARLVTTHTSYRAPRRVVVTHRLVVVRAHRAPARSRRRQLASVPPPTPAAPPPPPTPQPAAMETEQQPPAEPAPAAQDTDAGPGRRGRGHAYGHDHQDD